MKYIIKENAKATYGYEYQIIDGNDNVISSKLMNSKTHDNYFHIVIDELNIKYIAIKDIDNGKVDGIYEIKARQPRQSSTKTLLEYLTDDERKVYDDLMEKCKQRKAEDNKPLSPIELAKRKIEKLQAQIAKLEKEGK